MSRLMLGCLVFVALTLASGSALAVDCQLLGVVAGCERNCIDVTWGYELEGCTATFTVERAPCNTDNWMTLSSDASTPFRDCGPFFGGGASYKYRVTMICGGGCTGTMSQTTQCVTVNCP